jgi:ATP-binding protein involved in chromosome partitioning
MPYSKQSVAEALARLVIPGPEPMALPAGSVVRTAYCDGIASASLALPGFTPARAAAVKQAAEAAIRAHAGAAGETIGTVNIEVSIEPAAHSAGGSGVGGGGLLPGVRHVIAVGAGKGGVGKSTVAVNLAVGLARRGHAVGILDGDIYGPSLPTMLGLHAMQASVLNTMLQPFMVHGVKAMTIGKLVDPEKALIWRGPMAHGAFKQLVEQTQWGELDYLVVDMPPGTGDVNLTLAQLLKVTGAVVVCTPQRVAQDDAVRAVRMFQQLGIEVLGIVENMSYFIGDDGKEYDIFGRGGARTMAQRLGLPFLGAVPITMALRRHGDEGNPSANFDSAAVGATLPRDLDAMVEAIEAQVALTTIRLGAGPMLTIS